MERLKCKFLNIELKNPIITSSGCFGYGLEYKDYFDPNILGAIALKGITLEPRNGNLGTRIAETPAGMLNCVGLENPGIDYIRDVILNDLKKSNVKAPLIINISGHNIDEYIELAKKVDEIKEIDFVELNISCPNVKDGGMAFGANPIVAGIITKKIREATKKPLIVKLSPNVTNIVEIAKIVEDNGADAISIINTLLGMAIDVNTKKPVLGNIFGGLSGPAIKPIALRMVYQVYQNVKIPIVGMGGIASVEDALEFIFAGALIVSIGTGIFKNPILPMEIIDGLNKYCIENNINNITELVGAAHV
jgi:dihydroorotate dehydrogenase (NAD+) catalytic subunit